MSYWCRTVVAAFLIVNFIVAVGAQLPDDAALNTASPTVSADIPVITASPEAQSSPSPSPADVSSSATDSPAPAAATDAAATSAADVATTTEAPTSTPTDASASTTSTSTTTTTTITLPTPTGPPIIFNPNPVQIQDRDSKGSQMSLSLAPRYAPWLENSNLTIRVFLQGNGLKFSRCSFDFTKNNFNETHFVTIHTVPMFDTRTNGRLATDIRARVLVNVGENSTDVLAVANGYQQFVPITRQVTAGARCFSWGDPHLGSFDGRKFDLQLRGAFWLLRTPGIAIQVLHFPCNNWVVCNGAIAVQHNAEVLILTTTMNPNRTDVATTLFRGTWNATGLKTYSQPESNRHELAFKDGTKVSLSVNWWKDRSLWYGDVHVWIPSLYFNEVGGLCGSFNGNRRDDFVTPSGQSVSNERALGQAWRVAEQDDLFDRCTMGMIQGNLTGCQLDHLINEDVVNNPIADLSCTLPSSFESDGVYVEPPPSGYVEVSGDNLPLITAEDIVVPNLSVRGVFRRQDVAAGAAPLDATAAAAAEDAPAHPVVSPEDHAKYLLECKKITDQVPTCHGFVKPDEWIETCAADIAEMTALDSVESMKNKYLEECYRFTKPVVETVLGHDANTAQKIKMRLRRFRLQRRADPAAGNVTVHGDAGLALYSLVEDAVQAQEEAGLSVFPCPNNCSGRGQCIASSCACEPPFSGISCDISLKVEEQKLGIEFKPDNFTAPEMVPYVDSPISSRILNPGAGEYPSSEAPKTVAAVEQAPDTDVANNNFAGIAPGTEYGQKGEIKQVAGVTPGSESGKQVAGVASLSTPSTTRRRCRSRKNAYVNSTVAGVGKL
ncbi:hypothetical protein HK102_013977 [Quaeritorhiza haematococci]|nr:hypothetical protein HK102_013977 [Quaeritorhiza haematococci]